MSFDQAQSPRLGQPTPVESTYIRIFTGTEIPEAAWYGQMIYREDTQELQIYNGLAWESVVGGSFGQLTFVGPSIPTANDAGDLWYDSDDGHALYRAAAAGANTISAGGWVLMPLGLGALSPSVTARALGGITTTPSNTAPSAPKVGDVWIQTANNNRLVRWDGVAWVPVTLDGLPPTSSPAPTVTGNVGSLLITWTQIANQSPVTYKVYVSTSSSFTPAVGNYQGSVTDSAQFFLVDKLADNTPLDRSGTTVYYVRIVAEDGDGAAAPSTTASGSLKMIENVDIAPLSITASEIADFSIPVKKMHSLRHELY